MNLFNLADADEYREYSRRSPAEVAKHHGKVVALGQFKSQVAGDMAPRRVFILVEWESLDDFEGYRSDPALSELHPHRERGTEDYLWLLYDKLTDLKPLLGGSVRPEPIE